MNKFYVAMLIGIGLHALLGNDLRAYVPVGVGMLLGHCYRVYKDRKAAE